MYMSDIVQMGIAFTPFKVLWMHFSSAVILDSFFLLLQHQFGASKLPGCFTFLEGDCCRNRRASLRRARDVEETGKSGLVLSGEGDCGVVRRGMCRSGPEVREPREATLRRAAVELRCCSFTHDDWPWPSASPHPCHSLPPSPQPCLRHGPPPHHGLCPPLPGLSSVLLQEAFLCLSHAEDCTARLWTTQLLTQQHKAGDLLCATELRGTRPT